MIGNVYGAKTPDIKTLSIIGLIATMIATIQHKGYSQLMIYSIDEHQ